MVPFMMCVEALAGIMIPCIAGREGVVKVGSSQGTAVGVVVHFASWDEAQRVKSSSGGVCEVVCWRTNEPSRGKVGSKSS